ncbi:MAG: glycosyltransferase [Chloroflexota bacterium]
MKITVIAPTSLPALRANTIQVMKMTQAFSMSGHDVALLVPTAYPKTINKRWDKLAVHYGLQQEFPVYWLQSTPHWRGYDFGFRAVSWAQACHTDLIYTRHPQAAAWSSIKGIPTILEVHDTPHGGMGPLLFRSFLAGKGAQRLVAITHFLAQDLISSYSKLERISTITPISSAMGTEITSSFIVIAPDGVDLIRYNNLPAPDSARLALSMMAGSPVVEMDPDRFTAGYTGHLYEGRGSEFMLMLAERLPQMNFLLVGGEPEAVARLRVSIDEKGIKNVFLTGFIPNSELPLYQAACDVLLMPYQSRVAASSGGDISQYLSPMKVFEYMACKRAIIASHLPVFGEILNTNNAILIPHDDVNAWVNALTLLHDHPQQCVDLGEQSWKDIQKYDWLNRVQHVLKGIDLPNDNQSNQ